MNKFINISAVAACVIFSLLVMNCVLDGFNFTPEEVLGLCILGGISIVGWIVLECFAYDNDWRDK